MALAHLHEGMLAEVVRGDVTVVPNDVPYLLVDCQAQLIAAGVSFGALQPTAPFTLYSTRSGDKFTKAKLEDFRQTVLEDDLAFQPELLSRLVFYGSNESGVELEPEAANLLKS
ncbi:hypothetical protein OQA88_2501 [Cercophora sp. LCS_1]